MRHEPYYIGIEDAVWNIRHVIHTLDSFQYDEDTDQGYYMSQEDIDDITDEMIGAITQKSWCSRIWIMPEWEHNRESIQEAFYVHEWGHRHLLSDEWWKGEEALVFEIDENTLDGFQTPLPSEADENTFQTPPPNIRPVACPPAPKKQKFN